MADGFLGVIPNLNRVDLVYSVPRHNPDELTAAVLDTSRCLHAGSRVRPGHFRLCLFIQYCTSREKAHTFDARRFRKDPVRWLALKRYAAADS